MAEGRLRTMTNMKIDAVEADGGRVITLSGRFDAFAAPMVDAAIEDNLGPNVEILIDLANVNFIDSTGLATLVQGMKRARSLSGDLVLCNLNDAVRVIFDLTRLDRAFKITARS